MNVVYTNPGLMDRLVDIWDQPDSTQLPPVLFASGVFAQILGVSASTVSTVAAALDQNIAWPRLPATNVSLITHNVTIRYMAGLKSRMFLMYNDPDNGPRRFDIDRIVDPDEHKFELRILAFERADGVDPFDAFLTTAADVLVRDTSTGDKRGMSDPTFETIATGVRCRVTTSHAVPKGKENRAKTKLATASREVFMRPWFLDASPDGSFVPGVVVNNTTYNTQPLTHDHWLRIPSIDLVNDNNEPMPGEMYDIYQVDNPGLSNHHLEVWAILILP